MDHNTYMEMVKQLVNAGTTKKCLVEFYEGEPYFKVWDINNVSNLVHPGGNAAPIYVYSIVETVQTADGEQYAYRKDVDPDKVSFFKNGQPFDYGEGETKPHSFGVVPAIFFE